MSALAFLTYDVFTETLFAGNPLGVVEGANGLSDAQMQTIAREFNLSETIFIQTPDNASHTAKVRIFTPVREIPFAGHPTIGCAIHLADKAEGAGDFETTITLEEVAGLVPVKVTRKEGRIRAQLTAPVIPFAAGVIPSVEQAAAASGLNAADIGFDGHAPGVFEGGPRFLFIPVTDRDALARASSVEPHWSAALKAAGTLGIYFYTRGGDAPETSYRSRMMAPTGGIIEDPATGSATALLAAQLLASAALSEGANALNLEQGYDMGRPSDLALEIDVENGALAAIRVAGSAVRVSEGTIRAPSR